MVYCTLHMQTKSISTEFLELLKGQQNILNNTHFLEWFVVMCVFWRSNLGVQDAFTHSSSKCRGKVQNVQDLKVYGSVLGFVCLAKES